MSNVNFEHLFSPLQVGPMRVPNRICETTNTINSSMTPGLIDEHFIAHHAAKARGGTGWIGSETWLLDAPFPPETPDEIGLPVGCAGHQAAYQNPAFAESMARFCAEVHQSGSVVHREAHRGVAVHAAELVPKPCGQAAEGRRAVGRAAVEGDIGGAELGVEELPHLARDGDVVVGPRCPVPERLEHHEEAREHPVQDVSV